MTSKEQMLDTTPGSVGMAVLHALIIFVEDHAEETGLSLGDFTVPWRLKDTLREDPRRIIAWGEAVVYTSRSSEPAVREVEIAGERIELRIEPGFGDESFLTLYDEPPRILRNDRELIRRKAEETTATGVEYMFLYLSDGSVAMFEGEHYRVRLPFVEAAATLHTHPEGACGLSDADIQSGLDLLVSGGLMTGAATPSCIAFMLRKGLVSEEDYLRVKELLYYRRAHELPGHKLDTIKFGYTMY